MKLTKEYLLWLFEYDRENGKLYWKNHEHSNVISKLRGKEAGADKQDGYIIVKVKKIEYLIHRLIWFIETEKDISQFIDHINGDRSDNRFCNLRPASNRQNQQNQWKHREGRLVGCYYNKQHNLWRAQIKLPENKHQKYLGSFNTELEAHQRYVQELEARGLV